MIAHCCFDLPFSHNLWCWASFHVPVGYLCIFFGEMSIQVFCSFFNQVVCFLIELYELFIYSLLFLFLKDSFIGICNWLAVVLFFLILALWIYHHTPFWCARFVLKNLMLQFAFLFPLSKFCFTWTFDNLILMYLGVDFFAFFWGFFWSLSLACRWPFSPSVITWSFLCVCVLISSSYKDTSHIGLGPTLMTSF